MSAEPHLERALEAARCAQVNLSNIARAIPEIGSNPLFVVTALQLADAIKLLEGDDTVDGYDG